MGEIFYHTIKKSISFLPFLLCYIIFLGGLNAQSSVNDSLINLLATEIPDSLRYKIYEKVVWNLSRKNSERALQLSDEMMDLATKNNDYPKQIVAHYNHAVIYRNMGKYNLSLPHIEKYLEYRRSINDTLGIGHGTYQLALLQRLKGDYDESMAAYKESIEMYRHAENSIGLAMAINGQGMLYKIMNDRPAAIKNYQKALALNQNLKRKSGIRAAYHNLGLVYLEISLLDSSEYYLNKFMVLAQDEKNEYAIAGANESFGHLRLKQYNPLIAIDHYQKAQEIRKKMGHLKYVMANDRQLAECYLKLEDYNSALAHAQSSLAIAQENGILADQSLCELTLSKIYKLKNDFEKSLFHHEAYANLRDSVLNETITEQLAEMDAIYETKEQDRKIAALEYDSKIQEEQAAFQNKIIIGGSIALVALLVLLYQLYSQKQKIKTQNQLISKSLEEKDTLLREIHHRVKNNLQLVSSLLGLQSQHIQDPKALEALNSGKSRVKSMALIHQNLYNKENLTGVSIKDYIERLGAELVSSFNINGDRLKLRTDIADILLDVDTLVPVGLIINELLTNALKYAFPDGREGEIYIRIFEESGQLRLDFQDNGIGIDPNKLSSESFGFKLIDTLLDQLEGEMTIENKAGTSMYFSFSDYEKAA